MKGTPAWVLAAAIGSLATTSTEQVSFTRLDVSRLWIGEPGVAVIRDSVAWRQLWTYYAEIHQIQRGDSLIDSIASAPAVDFSRSMVLVAGLGATSGCGNILWSIRRVEVSDSGLLAVIAPPQQGGITCAMLIEPVDAVVVSRTDRPVTWAWAAGSGRSLPPPARWWAPPTVDAALGPPSLLQRVSWRMLPRDSTLPLADLAGLAERFAGRGGDAEGRAFVRNPRVRAHAGILATLAKKGLTAAAVVLFDRHGFDVAADRTTDTATLRLILDRLEGGNRPDIARALVRNPVMLQPGSELLRRLPYQLQRDSVACADIAVSLGTLPVKDRSPMPTCHTSHPFGVEPRWSGRPRVRLVHRCDGSFVLESTHSDSMEIAWAVPETGDSGRVWVPPRGRFPFGERRIAVTARGEIHVSQSGQVFQVLASQGSSPCRQPSSPDSGTAPQPPMTFPEEWRRWVIRPGAPETRYYRRLVRVVFYDTTGGSNVRQAISSLRAQIYGGGPYPHAVILRVPDPGRTWASHELLLRRVAGTPGVQAVSSIPVRALKSSR